MRVCVVVVGLLATADDAGAQAPCPAAADLPQLTIDNIHDPAVPVVDDWQIFWGNVPISDAQLAQLAGEDPVIDRTRREMETRGTWVYIGMGIAGAGTAASCAGWVLYGQNNLSQGITLPMAVGGLIVGLVGFLTVTESIRTPLEPHLAPTPNHRLSRDETRRLVAAVNRRLFLDICEAAGAAQRSVVPRILEPSPTASPDADQETPVAPLSPTKLPTASP